MNELELIHQRHSVRRYLDQPIELETIHKLNDFITNLNKKSGLNFQFIVNEPNAFNSKLFHYGMFKNVKNYFVLVGKKQENLEELCGYYGEKLVLYSQHLGLNTCWVALTYDKAKTSYILNDDEKLVIIISVGYGETQGKAHKSKAFHQVTNVKNGPSWFVNGVNSALLAPTAVNMQNFLVELNGNIVNLKPKNKIYYSKVDIGILKYHFEIGAGKENFKWK